ncbi:MAG TPA: hypothetical protein DCX06_00845 [Opitutae bacterium]|nr:hypothetical protein [Opitutae bacterium]
MKKVLTIAALAALATVSANAQSLIAAWDFNYPDSFGGQDINGDFAPDTSAAATFGTGTFSWASQPTSGLSNSANLSSNNLLRPGLLDPLGAGFGWLVDANGSSGAVLTFQVDLTNIIDAELTFAYAGQNGSFDLTAAGQSFSPASDALGSVDLDALEGGLANIEFSLSNFSGAENFLLDNVQVTGNAVPEPSAYAAILGVVALGFVAVRRRK